MCLKLFLIHPRWYTLQHLNPVMVLNFVFKIHTAKVDWPVTFKRSGQARSKGRDLLFLVSQQNLNPSSWSIWHTNNCQKQISYEKVTAPKSTEGQKFKKNKPSNTNTSKASSQTFKNFLVGCSIANRVQRWFVELQVAFL